MTTEKHDPWALLREAEWAVAYVAAGPNGPKDAKALRDRIYAALAAHDAVPLSEVAWKTDTDCTNDELEFYEAYPDAHTGLDVVRLMDGKWRWTACREVEAQGYCDTLDEAKSAAIAAARGMR